MGQFRSHFIPKYIWLGDAQSQKRKILTKKQPHYMYNNRNESWKNFLKILEISSQLYRQIIYLYKAAL